MSVRLDLECSKAIDGLKTCSVLMVSKSSGVLAPSPYRSVTQSIGLLAYTFLRSTGKEDIVVPIVLMEGRNKGKRAASGSQQQQRQQQQEQPPSPSDMQLQQQPSSSTAENVGGSFDESGKLVLDRMTLWFDDPNVKRDIKDILQAHYHAPWRTYNEVDDVTKEQWWNLFTKRCTRATEFEPEVRHEFQSRVGNRLRDMFYKLMHNVSRTLPKWESETVYKKAQDVIKVDETFKKRSAQNKKNKRGGSMENPIEPTHYQGSSSAVQHAKKMAKENEGKLPSPIDLLLRTHFKDVLGKGKVPANL